MNNQLNNKSVDVIFLTSRHVILKVNVTVCILVYPKHNFNCLRGKCLLRQIKFIPNRLHFGVHQVTAFLRVNQLIPRSITR